jgi:hypothetical protein
MPTALTAEKIFRGFNTEVRQSGVTSIAVTASDAIVLTEDQVLKKVITFTGAGGSTATITFPKMGTGQAGMSWFIYNDSTTTLTLQSYDNDADDTDFSTGLTIDDDGAYIVEWTGTVHRARVVELAL